MYSTSKVSQQINLQGIDSDYTHKSFKVLSLTSKSQHFISSFHKIYIRSSRDPWHQNHNILQDKQFESLTNSK